MPARDASLGRSRQPASGWTLPVPGLHLNQCVMTGEFAIGGQASPGGRIDGPPDNQPGSTGMRVRLR
jgi:hypothetical protein